MVVLLLQFAFTPIELIAEIGKGRTQHDFYLHDNAEPREYIEFKLGGWSMFKDIQSRYYDMEKLYHMYHCCENCNQCHQCPRCKNCLFVQDGECLNCNSTRYSSFSQDFPTLDDDFHKWWILGTHLYYRSQGLIIIGARIHRGVLGTAEIDKITNIARNMNNCQYSDYTKQPSKTQKRNKCFFGAGGYLWSSDHKKLNTYKYAFGIRTQVAPIPPALMIYGVGILVSRGVIPEDMINAVALNWYYLSSGGISAHLDEISRFHICCSIWIVRLLSRTVLRYGTKRFQMNPLFGIEMQVGDVYEMRPWQFGTTWIKHCICNNDLNQECASLLLRRMYPLLIQMSKQADRFLPY